MTRQEKTVTVFRGEEFEGDWPTTDYPTTLVDAIAWFEAKLALIPVKYRAGARCDISSTSGYEDSHYGEITIEYRRPETDEEMASRYAEEEARKARLIADERSVYEQLRRKYEK